MTAGEIEEEDCGDLYFEECQCNLHRCSWDADATFEDPDEGTCFEGGMPPPEERTSGRTQVVDHYKIKTVSTRFQDELINNFFYFFYCIFWFYLLHLPVEINGIICYFSPFSFR